MTSANTPYANGDFKDDLFVVDGLGHSYGTNEVLRDINFSVGKGKFLSIVGPSGTGKTTMLQCFAGLRKPTAGEIRFEGQPVLGPPEDLAVVFQDYSRSLMPWLSIKNNVTLPLRSAGMGRKERDARALEVLEQVGLAGVDDKYPWQLSGGMQQRVAIARAVAIQPAAIVMDEPFASVDAQTRADLEDLVLRIKDDLQMTVLLVTHDIDEAVYMGDNVLVLGGRPSTVQSFIPVNFEEPRDQVATKATKDFAEVRSEVYELIREAKKTAPGTSALPTVR